MSARAPKKMAALSARIFGNVVRAPNMRWVEPSPPTRSPSQTSASFLSDAIPTPEAILPFPTIVCIQNGGNSTDW